MASTHMTTGTLAPTPLLHKVASLLERGTVGKGELLALWLAIAEREYRASAQLAVMARKEEMGDDNDVARVEALRQELAKVQGTEFKLRGLSKDLAKRSGEIEAKYGLIVKEQLRKQKEQCDQHRERVDGIQARIGTHTARAEAIEAEKEALQGEITDVLALLQDQDDLQSKDAAEGDAADAGEEYKDLYDADGNVDVQPPDRERFLMAQAEYRTKLLLLGAEDRELQKELLKCQSRVGKVADEIAFLHSDFGAISAAISELDVKSSTLVNDTKECERRLVSLTKSLKERQTAVQTVKDEAAAARIKAGKYDQLSEGLLKALAAAEAESAQP